MPNQKLLDGLVKTLALEKFYFADKVKKPLGEEYLVDR